MKLFVLGLAGAAGTLARFGVMEGMKRICAPGFPWGTWVVNTAGCFLFGLIWVFAEESRFVSSEYRLYALTGFMGAFTTFSTFAFESVDLCKAGDILACLVNVAGQNLAGLAAVMCGMVFARSIV